MGNGSQSKKNAVLWSLCMVSGAAILASAVLVAMTIMPTRKPDYEQDDIETVFAFTMDKDFNRLPAEERLDYLLGIIDRFRNFDQDDAVLLAQFASDMSLKMREQIEANIISLGVDLWTESALEYSKVPPGERVAFIESLLIEFDKLEDRVSGKERDLTDEERLARRQRRADQDAEWGERRGNGSIEPERLGSFFESYEYMSDYADPGARGEIANLMLDMTRHMRGEELDK